MDDAGFRCMVGGSVAAMFYGEPRATMDLDLVLDTRPGDANRIEDAFPRARYYFPPREILEQELGRARDRSFRVLDQRSFLKADLYFAGDDPLLRFGLENRTLHSVEGQELFAAPATYMVPIKLSYYSISEQPKHLADIAAMLRCSPESIDRRALASWIDRLGLHAAWRAVEAGR